MKTHPILLLLLVFGIHLYSFAGGKETQKDFGFAKHSAEISVTPNVSYYIYSKGKLVTPLNKPYEGNYPFIGYAFGLQYLLRPVSLLAVSAGLNMQVQGAYRRITTYPMFGDPYISSRTIVHTGYLTLPICLHLFKRMPKSTFEFAVGPDFCFPVFARYETTVFNSDGDKTDKGVQVMQTGIKYLGKNASLGLSILLGAQLYLCKKADLFIGPQVSFLNLAYFDRDRQLENVDAGGFIDVNLGLKLGFRLHSAPKQANR